MPGTISESPGIQDLIHWASLYISTEARGAKSPTQDHTVFLRLSCAWTPVGSLSS